MLVFAICTDDGRACMELRDDGPYISKMGNPDGRGTRAANLFKIT